MFVYDRLVQNSNRCGNAKRGRTSSHQSIRRLLRQGWRCLIVAAAMMPFSAQATKFTVEVSAPHMAEYDSAAPVIYHDVAISFVGDTNDWVIGDADWGDYLDFHNIDVEIDGGALTGGRSFTIDVARYLPSGWDFYLEPDGDTSMFLHDESHLDGLIGAPGTNNSADGLRAGQHSGNLSYLSVPGLLLGNVVTPSQWTLTRIDSPGTVPEPGTWAMMLGGFGMIGGVLRRVGRRHAVGSRFV
ncbi:MAG: PEPxxWA-CTERM sorting domain-containing protein [Janthinobacterium lividum]